MLDSINSCEASFRLYQRIVMFLQLLHILARSKSGSPLSPTPTTSDWLFPDHLLLSQNLNPLFLFGGGGAIDKGSLGGHEEELLTTPCVTTKSGSLSRHKVYKLLKRTSTVLEIVKRLKFSRIQPQITQMLGARQTSLLSNSEHVPKMDQDFSPPSSSQLKPNEAMESNHEGFVGSRGHTTLRSLFYCSKPFLQHLGDFEAQRSIGGPQNRVKVLQDLQDLQENNMSAYSLLTAPTAAIGDSSFISTHSSKISTPSSSHPGSVSSNLIYRTISSLSTVLQSHREHLGVEGEGKALFAALLSRCDHPSPSPVHTPQLGGYSNALQSMEAQIKEVETILSQFQAPQPVTSSFLSILSQEILPCLFKSLTQGKGIFRVNVLAVEKEGFFDHLLPLLSSSSPKMEQKLDQHLQDTSFNDLFKQTPRTHWSEHRIFDEMVLRPLHNFTPSQYRKPTSGFPDQKNAADTSPYKVTHSPEMSHCSAIVQFVVCLKGMPCLHARRLLEILHQFQTLVQLHLLDISSSSSISDIGDLTTPSDNATNHRPQILCFVDCNPSGMVILETLARSHGIDEIRKETRPPLPPPPDNPEAEKKVQVNPLQEPPRTLSQSSRIRWCALTPTQLASMSIAHHHRQPLSPRDQAILSRLASPTYQVPEDAYQNQPAISTLQVMLQKEAKLMQQGLGYKVELQALIYY